MMLLIRMYSNAIGIDVKTLKLQLVNKNYDEYSVPCLLGLSTFMCVNENAVRK